MTVERSVGPESTLQSAATAIDRRTWLVVLGVASAVLALTTVAATAALTDAEFMDRTRPRPSLYGDANAASRIVAALERQDAAIAAAPQEAFTS